MQTPPRSCRPTLTHALYGPSLALLLALAGPACGSDDAPGGDTSGASDTATAADTAVPGDATDTSGDSGGGSERECAANTDCTEAGAVCSCEGSCVVPEGAACEENRNCGITGGVTYWCNPCVGHCEPMGQICDDCQNSDSCDDGGACIPYVGGGSGCGRECISDVGCPTGFLCQEVGGVNAKQCVARSGSCSDLDLCRDDGDCPDGTICNEGNKQCAPGCTEDGQCVEGKICALGRCKAPCGGNDDCTAPAECVEGRCKVPGSCEEAADCPDPATYCDRVAGECKDGCLVDTDCKDAAMECVDKSCVPKGCLHNYQCAFSEECDQATGQCKPTPDNHCGDCAEGAPIACDDPDLCVEFQDENEQSLGEFCLLPCKDDPIDACPQGYGCQNIQGEEGGDPMYYCVRECHVDPVAQGAE